MGILLRSGKDLELGSTVRERSLSVRIAHFMLSTRGGRELFASPTTDRCWQRGARKEMAKVNSTIRLPWQSILRETESMWPIRGIGGSKYLKAAENLLAN